MGARKATFTAAQLSQLNEDWNKAGELLAMAETMGRIQASPCYAADTCTMSPDCPFHTGCQSAEWGRDDAE